MSNELMNLLSKKQIQKAIPENWRVCEVNSSKDLKNELNKLFSNRPFTNINDSIRGLCCLDNRTIYLVKNNLSNKYLTPKTLYHEAQHAYQFNLAEKVHLDKTISKADNWYREKKGNPTPLEKNAIEFSDTLDYKNREKKAMDAISKTIETMQNEE